MDVNISGGGRRPSGSTGSGSNCELLSYGTKTGFLQNRYTKNQQLKNSRSVTGLNSTEASFGNAYHSGNTYTLNRPSSHNQPGGPERQQKHIKHGTYTVVQAPYKLLRKSKQTDLPVFTFCEVIILSLGNFNKNTNCQHFVMKVKLTSCLSLNYDFSVESKAQTNSI